MNIEKLTERDEAFIERTQSCLDNTSLVEFMQEDGIKELYEHIFSESGFGELIANSRPTYYRKDSALASGYAAADTDPVIVYLKPEINHEADLIDYTGLNKQFFLSQVAQDQIIPVRARGDEYRENEFYQSFFEDWRHHEEIGDRFPIFANPVEETIKSDVSSDKYWKSKAKEVANTFELAGESVQPTPELPSRPATKYLAERLIFLRAVNQESIIELIEGLLYEYKDSLSALNEPSQQYLDNAARAAFYGSMLYSAPIFKSMGSAITMSPTDYANAVDWLNTIVEERRERGALERSFISNLIEITAPVSSSLLNIDQKAKTRLTVPERGKLSQSGFNKLNNSEDVYETLEDTTELQHSHTDKMIEALSEGSFSGLSDSYDELRECRHNLHETKLEEVTAAKDWLQTRINYVSEVVGHLPRTPVDGGPAEFITNRLLSDTTWEFFDVVLEAYRNKDIQKFVDQQPTMAMKGRVWESSYEWAESPTIY